MRRVDDDGGKKSRPDGMRREFWRVLSSCAIPPLGCDDIDIHQMAVMTTYSSSPHVYSYIDVLFGFFETSTR